MPANSQASWIDFIVRFVGEIKRSYILSAVVYIYIVKY